MRWMSTRRCAGRRRHPRRFRSCPARAGYRRPGRRTLRFSTVAAHPWRPLDIRPWRTRAHPGEEAVGTDAQLVPTPPARVAHRIADGSGDAQRGKLAQSDAAARDMLEAGLIEMQLDFGKVAY